MVRRLVILSCTGWLLALLAQPAPGQSRSGDIFIVDDDLEQTAPEQKPRPKPIPPKNKLPAQVWKTLAPFKDSAEFDAFRKRASEIARSHAWTWGFLRQRMAQGPLLAQEIPEPCDPAIEDCGEPAEEVMVSGLRATAQNSITNNQVSGVDEGDIVKAYDRFLVVLMHGRLFSVDTGGAAGELRLIDRVDAYQKVEEESWIDEMLIVDDTLLVTGYSYETSSSNIALFRIDKQGRFSFIARYFLESDDYYSWENYASRIVDGKLVIYTPFDLSEYAADKAMPLPRMRRFTEAQGFSEWQPLFSVSDVYRPIQAAVYPAMHVMSVCPVDPRAELRCEARGVVGPWQHEMYVAPDHAYLWLTTDPDEISEAVDDQECAPGESVLRKRGTPSAAYRMTVSSGALAAVHTEGSPRDQFALEEKGSEFWALVRRPPLGCEARDAEGVAYEPLVLLNIAGGEFTRRPMRLKSSSYFEMPVPEQDWGEQARFTARHLLYGFEDDNWRGGRSPSSPEIVVVPLSDPQHPKKVSMPHGAERVELFGQHAVVFGTLNETDLAVSSLWLGARPRRVDTQIVPGASESEGRSHAFNALAQKDGSGMFGLPIYYDEEFNRNEEGTPTYVHFFSASRELRLEDASELKSTPARADRAGFYECQVSCYDWYGNSRPIFFRERVFALIGHEMVEGSVASGRIVEAARLDLTGPREHQR